MTHHLKTAIEDILLALVGTLMILVALTAHAAVSKKPQGNSLGFLQYAENPYIYVEGEVHAAVYVSKNALVVRIQPRGTYSLYTEDLLFCPGAAEVLATKSSPVVLVYERIAHQTVEGLGCHVLKYADEIKTTRYIH